jgi:hypothetical protein
MQRIWIGEDPLAIESLFYKMTALQEHVCPRGWGGQAV